MKKIYMLLCLAVLSLTTAMAQWTTSDTETHSLTKEGEYNQCELKQVFTSDGKLVMVWLRPGADLLSKDNHYRLYMQIFDKDGNALLEEGGKLIVDKPSRSWITDYTLTLAPNDDVLIGYYDCRNDENRSWYTSYFYRYDSNGNAVWSEDGVLGFDTEGVDLATVSDATPRICCSGDNVYVSVQRNLAIKTKATEENWKPTYEGEEMPEYIYLWDDQYILSCINADGECISKTEKFGYCALGALYPAPDGDIYLTFQPVEFTKLQCVRYNNKMESVWEGRLDVEPQQLSPSMAPQTPQIKADGQGGLICGYFLKGSMTAQCALQRVKPDGTTWEDRVLAVPNAQGTANSFAFGVRESDGTIMHMQCYQPSSANTLTINKLDIDGNYLWKGTKYEEGRTIVNNDRYDIRAVLVEPRENSWILVYGIYNTSKYGYDYVVREVNEDGKKIWDRQFETAFYLIHGQYFFIKDNLLFWVYEVDMPKEGKPVESYQGPTGMLYRVIDIANHTEGIEQPVVINPNAKAGVAYDLQGRQVNDDYKGIVIVDGKPVVRK